MKTALAGSALAAQAGAIAGGNDNGPIKIGFLGVSHSHAREKVRLVRESPDYELVGIAERDERLRKNYEAAGVRTMSREKLLAQVEVIAVESAVRDHASDAKAALKAGRHVHVEKPPADTLAGFREMVALAEANGLLLQVGYMWRFNPGFNAIFDAVQQGRLGDVFLVRAAMNSSVGPEARREWAEFRGGSLFELASHLVDAVVRLLGRPERITSFLKQSRQFDDDLADNTMTVFEYPRTKAVVSSAAIQPRAGGHRVFEVLGTNGTAILRPLEPPTLTIDLAKAAGPYDAGAQAVPMPEYRRYVDEFIELAAAIRGNRPLGVSLREEVIIQETLLRACEMTG